MSSSFNRIKKNIIEAMQSTNNQGTSAYDSVAEVRRVEGDTAWVHIAGGVDETPVKLTIAAKAGDVVQVRVGGGRAWITGNASAPPTDDKTAIAAKSLADIAGNRANTAKVAAEAAQEAAGTAQADIDSQKEFFWHDANGAHVLGSKTAATRYRTDIDSEGMHIKDVSGAVQEVAKFTADGAQIGKNGNNARLVIQPSGLNFFDNRQVEAFRIISPVNTSESTQARYSVARDYQNKVGALLATTGPFTWKVELPFTPVSVIKSMYYTQGGMNAWTLTSDMSADVHYTLEENELTCTIKSSYSGAYISDFILWFDTGIPLYSAVIGSYPASSYQDYKALVIGNGTSSIDKRDAFTVDWNGKVVAGDGIYAGGNSHVEGNLTTRGLVNNMQAGWVYLEASGTTKTVSGTKYYELRGKVKFANAFDNTPMVTLSPISTTCFRLLPPSVDTDTFTREGFTAIMYRNSNTGTSVMWMAMEATQ